MASFWQFFYSFLESTAKGLKDKTFADELPDPKRLKVDIMRPPQSGAGAAAPNALAAFKCLATYFNNQDDVAYEGDLHVFDEIGSPAMPSYIC